METIKRAAVYPRLVWVDSRW